MKKSGIFAASVAAASATAMSATSVSSSSPEFTAESKPKFSREDLKQLHGKIGSDAAGNKFAPRFDGLRFIETLVTAHR